MFWYWFFVGPALALAFLSLRGERRRAAYVAERLAENPAYLPPATVIVPVKGDDDGLKENLAALASLDYPDYELIVVAHRAVDIPPGVLPTGVRVVLTNAASGATGEKVQNLMAAVLAAAKQSEILAFADSDGRPTRRWLRALATPLADPEVGASTGYRWFTPVPPTFWTLLRGVWDAVACGRLGPGDNSFAWGGAMAIRKNSLSAARVLERWNGALSDDYTLSAAVHALGLKIAYAPGALTPSFDRVSACQFFRWAVRQMKITRVFHPRLWWPALAAHVVYCGGMAAAIVASIRGDRLAGWALIAQLSPGMLKGMNRATLAKAALPEYEPWFKRHAWVHATWVPLATWIWLVVLIASAMAEIPFSRRGRRYELREPERIITS